MRPLVAVALLLLSGCSQVHLTQEARERQCLDYGHTKGTPAFGACMQKEREMANDFWWGDSD